MKNKELYKSLKSNLASAYLIPVAFETAKNYTLVDIENKEYIDFSAGYGVANIGWQNPKMLQAQIKQINKSNYAPPWMPTQEADELAKKLISFFPQVKYKCLRATGGANANEVALSIFSNITDGKIGTFKRSYHGWSQATLGMSEIAKFKLPFVRKYYESIKMDTPNIDSKSIQKVEEFFDNNPDIKIFIAEPIIGSGGVIIPHKDYWKKFYEICKKRNIFLILDEAITGFGRTGYMLASHYFEIEPDAIILAKGVSSGYSAIGAVLIKEEYLKNYKFGDVSATFSWTPYSASITKTNIDIIEQDRLCDNSIIIGDYLKTNIEKLFKKYYPEETLEVRGIGLMIAVELINKIDKTPNTYLVGRLFYEFLNNGLMWCTSGDNNALIALPPLTIDKQGCDKALSIMQKVFIKKKA
jgi:4-aminobutyrate aminotransferase-like enzyme